jgi:hypothetical protein
MAKKHEDMQKFIRYYKRGTGKTEVTMAEIAKAAADQGWPMPRPVSALERLAKQFSEAAREEIKHDKKTGLPYRVNHAMRVTQGNQQLTLWIDIDEAPRQHVLKSLIQYREQMVGEALQVTLDADHWNSLHPKEEPIQIPLDFTDDVAWRKSGPKEEAS